jgi:hypothetical protein
LVIVLLEEKCLWCSARLAGSIEMGEGYSRTSGDFDPEHAVDVQNAGSDRVLKAVNACGRCPACGALFYYKAFSVMQMTAKSETASGKD